MEVKRDFKRQLLILIRNTIIIIGVFLLLIMIMFFARVKFVHAEAYHGDKPQRGWFFYEDPALKQEQETKRETKQEKTEQKKKKDFEFPVVENAPEPVKQFLLNPNEDTARAYLLWQYKYFEHLKKLGYTLRDAYIKFGSEVYPIAGYSENPAASLAFLSAREKAIEKILLSARDKIGIIYFYKYGCPECKLQKNVLRIISEKYHIPIRAVSVDGQQDPDLPFPSTYNPSLFEKYNITAVPTLLAVIHHNGQTQIAGLGVGFTSLDLIEQQLIGMLIQAEIIKEKDLNPRYGN
ncbi:conjugal transfer protein TraF [Thermodesulfovibrio sp. TK110]